jgi:colanic acid biosynthesis glycosyl transferase WcaI
MRILVVGINYAPDLVGVAKYNTELCEELVCHGHDVQVVTAPPYYPEWSIPPAYRTWHYRSEEINGVSVIRSPVYVPRKPSGARRLVHHASFAMTSFWPVLFASVRWRPEVIFSVAPSLLSAGFSAWVARRTGAVSWLHLQDFEVDAAFDLGLLSNRWLRALMIGIERKILGSFNCVSTISPQMVERLVSKGVDKEKVCQIRNWTDTEQITPGIRNPRFRRERLHLDDAHFIALYSGTMSNKHGLEIVLDAARSLDRAGSNIRFVLCGDGPQKGMLQGLAAGLSNVQFLGLQVGESFVELLKTADVHLVPQKAGALDLVLPSKLGGILASGKPVIVMAEPGSGLATEVAGAGLVIPPGKSDALAKAVRALADNPDLRSSIGKIARTIALLRWNKSANLGSLQQTLLALRMGGAQTSVPTRLSWLNKELSGTVRSRIFQRRFAALSDGRFGGVRKERAAARSFIKASRLSEGIRRAESSSRNDVR